MRQTVVPPRSAATGAADRAVARDRGPLFNYEQSGPANWHLVRALSRERTEAGDRAGGDREPLELGRERGRHPGL